MTKVPTPHSQAVNNAMSSFPGIVAKVEWLEAGGISRSVGVIGACVAGLGAEAFCLLHPHYPQTFGVSLSMLSGGAIGMTLAKCAKSMITGWQRRKMLPRLQAKHDILFGSLNAKLGDLKLTPEQYAALLQIGLELTREEDPNRNASAIIPGTGQALVHRLPGQSSAPGTLPHTP